jgi:hypothetical protein
VGTPRSALLAEFGYPTSTDTRDGKKYDIYRFTQGYSGGAKAARAVGHGIVSVLTLGLWEVIGTPIEAVNSGDLTAYEVGYGNDDRVDVVITLIQTANTGSGSDTPSQQSADLSNQHQSKTTSNLNTLPNPAAKLEQLDSMRQKGLITQQDYDNKKAEILKNL